MITDEEKAKELRRLRRGQRILAHSLEYLYARQKARSLLNILQDPPEEWAIAILDRQFGYITLDICEYS